MIALLNKSGFKLVNHACIEHKLVDHKFRIILIYYTHFYDKQGIFCEFYKFQLISEIFLELKTVTGTFYTGVVLTQSH
jgi:hypothetical protein